MKIKSRTSLQTPRFSFSPVSIPPSVQLFIKQILSLVDLVNSLPLTLAIKNDEVLSSPQRTVKVGHDKDHYRSSTQRKSEALGEVKGQSRAISPVRAHNSYCRQKSSVRILEHSQPQRRMPRISSSETLLRMGGSKLASRSRLLLNAVVSRLLNT